MGIREYLNRTNTPARWKTSLGAAFILHALVFFAGSVVMATQAQYGMSSNSQLASTGGDPKVRPTPEDTVDLEEDLSDTPVEKKVKPKPVPTPKSQGTGGPVSSGALAIPSYYNNPPPPYPEEARQAKQAGLVRLLVQVDTQGRVASVALAQSSGFPLLDEAAQKTVKDWQFKPARMAGIAVSTSVNIPVLFRLEDAK